MDLTDSFIRGVLAIGVNVIFALFTYFRGLISRSGAIGGFIVGFLIYYFTDWRGWAVLFTFFILGTLVTKVKYEEKAKAGIAQEDEGRRGAKHAFANSATALVLAIIAYILTKFSSNPDAAIIFLIGYTGAFATALSDTSSSEIGQAYGKTTFLLTNFKRVPPGTEGAVSIEGTLAGIFASIILALVALIVEVISGWAGVVAVVVAAFIGNTLESLIGSAIEKVPFISNEVTNFINTLIGAVAAMGLYALLS